MTEVFQVTVSPLELIVRATLIYWFLFLLLRFGLRRDAGAVGLADILLIVLIADAAQNGMAGNAKSVSDAAIVIATLAAWSYALNWLSFQFPAFARFTEAGVVPVIRHGRMLRENMRRELLTADELMSHLRENGIENIADVKFACIESDGHISVIRYDGKSTKARTGGLA